MHVYVEQCTRARGTFLRTGRQSTLFTHNHGETDAFLRQEKRKRERETRDARRKKKKQETLLLPVRERALIIVCSFVVKDSAVPYAAGKECCQTTPWDETAGGAHNATPRPKKVHSTGPLDHGASSQRSTEA